MAQLPSKSVVEGLLFQHKLPNDYGHWTWGGASDINGYGIIYLGDDLYKVSELSVWLWQGLAPPTPIPIPKETPDPNAIVVPDPLTRSCGLPSCYNPAHLVYVQPVPGDEDDKDNDEDDPELLVGQTQHHKRSRKHKE